MKKLVLFLVALLIAGVSARLQAQGVTTSSLSGFITDNAGSAIPGANILAVHTPSGTSYGTVSMADGRFAIIGMRIGGPYKVTISFVGYKSVEQDNIFLTLGSATNLSTTLVEEQTALAEVVVYGGAGEVFSSDRTGASTNISRNVIENMPTISRNLSDFTRLTPQARGTSIAGQDGRLNNITVDGSYFNNSFGLADVPGQRTGVSPISLDAIEEVQVNIAPYDVRQGNFTGAGINTVTRSGTNDFSGSAYYLWRGVSQVGTKAKELDFNPGQFDYYQIGARLGGPILKNKVFFFASYEEEKLTEPGTTFRANNGGEPVEGNVTRVLASDLDELSNFLSTNFGYETGPYQDYDHETFARKFLVKLDFNLHRNHKLSLRYNHLDSNTDVLLSNSSSLGFGTRRSNLFGLNYQNSNYKILENIRSIIGELNSKIGDNMANNLIIGYTYQDESRDSRGSFFPMVDILDGGQVYTTFGFEPFTPNNELRYKTFQLQDNFTIFKANHTITFGTSLERYESENVFFPGSQSAYVYNSLDDFYADAGNYLNPDPNYVNKNLRRFQVRYNNVPGQEKPVQPLQVFYAGFYGQDEWQVNQRLSLTLGLRVDVPFFGNTALYNPEVPRFTFLDENLNGAKFSTDKLPDPNLLWSPRLGFNWDATGNRSTQVRGGTGIFTSRPAYVWISNQVGNNGLLTGFSRLDNTTQRPFSPDPDTYKPTDVTGAPAAQYELAFTDPNFKFPQIWRTNIAVDQKLPWGLVGTAELIYNRDVNGIYYINGNLSVPTTNLVGPDDRPLYRAGTGNRLYTKLDNAIILKNQNVGYSYNISATIEKPFTNGLYAKVGYNFGISKNTVDPGSIAFGSWNNNQHSGNPNDPGVGFSVNSAGHRLFAALNYRIEYFKFGGTSVSLFWEGRTISNASYVVSGDINRDGGTSNDLIYIPKKGEETQFYEFTASGKTFTVAEQQTAWEAFIEQDKYMSANRGKYVQRGAVILPMVYRADFSIAQDFFVNAGGKRNTLQFRVDILNVGNLLNQDWGVSQRLVSTTPLVARPSNAGGALDANQRPVYRLQNVGDKLITGSLQQTADLADVYRIQFGVRYIFN
jgi:outer membrane receptor protein involved in Fe transport